MPERFRKLFFAWRTASPAPQTLLDFAKLPDPHGEHRTTRTARTAVTTLLSCTTRMRRVLSFSAPPVDTNAGLRPGLRNIGLSRNEGLVPVLPAAGGRRAPDCWSGSDRLACAAAWPPRLFRLSSSAESGRHPDAGPGSVRR